MQAPRGRAARWMLGVMAVLLGIGVAIVGLRGRTGDAARSDRGSIITTESEPTDQHGPVAPLVVLPPPRGDENLAPAHLDAPVMPLSSGGPVHLAHLTGTLLRGE